MVKRIVAPLAMTANGTKAKEFAEDWYLQLHGKLRDGELKSGKPFREAAKLYLREFDIMTQGQHARTNGHLVPFFGNMVLPEITAGKINGYRIHRLEECKALRDKPPAHNTMHQEIVTFVAPDFQNGSAARMDQSPEDPVDASAINVMKPRPKKDAAIKGSRRVESQPLADAM